MNVTMKTAAINFIQMKVIELTDNSGLVCVEVKVNIADLERYYHKQ